MCACVSACRWICSHWGRAHVHMYVSTIRYVKCSYMMLISRFPHGPLLSSDTATQQTWPTHLPTPSTPIRGNTILYIFDAFWANKHTHTCVCVRMCRTVSPASTSGRGARLGRLSIATECSANGCESRFRFCAFWVCANCCQPLQRFKC